MITAVIIKDLSVGDRFSIFKRVLMVTIVVAETLTNVLPKRIVINSCFGLFSKYNILFDVFVPSFSSFFSCILANEKKAVSLPENRAENIININKNR
jgi:hypothetical protein